MSRLAPRAARRSSSIRPQARPSIALAIESLEQRRLLSATYDLLDTIHDASLDPLGYPASPNAFATNGDLIAVGRELRGAGGAGEVEIYDSSDGSLVGTLANPEGSPYFHFGRAVAFVGDWIVVSSLVDTGSGDADEALWIYESVNDADPTKVIAPEVSVGNQWRNFGGTLASFDDQLLVAAQSELNTSTAYGAVLRYDIAVGGATGLTASLVTTYSQSIAGDRFGEHLAAGGDTILVYADNSDPDASFDAGAVVHEFSATTNALVGTYQSTNGDNDHFFGFALGVAGDAAFIADPIGGTVLKYDDPSSSPTSFTGDPLLFGFFGQSLAVNGDVLVVGAPSEIVTDDFGATVYDGAVYIFDHTTGDLLAHVTNPTPGADPFFPDAFGFHVMGLSGGRVAVVDITDASNGALGGIYIFGSETIVPPVVDAGGSYAGVRLQDITLSGSATEGSAPIASYEWDLNYNGITFDVDASGASPTVSFGASGTYTIALRVTDENGQTSIATASVSIAATALQGGTLYVGGTSGAEGLTITKTTDGLSVTVDGVTQTFSGASTVVVLAGEGNDTIEVGGSVTQTVVIYGGAGDDSIKGGGGADIVIGGEGNDLVVGGSGRDILIGGVGADRIVGNTEDDILIAGATSHDLTGLTAILAEWTSGRSYTERVANITGDTPSAIRANGDSFFNDTTLFADGAVDVLTGSAGTDWFLFSDAADGDYATDLKSTEFADDIAFIEEVIA